MSNSDDLVALLAVALRQTSLVVGAVRSEQLSMPTPCRSWDVGTLVNHIIDDTRSFTEMARGAAYSRETLEVPHDEWARAFTAGAERLLAAWREQGDIDVAARNRLNQQIAEFALHSWDVATATGQSAQLDEGVAVRALAWGRETLKPEFRGDEDSGKAFGPEVAVPSDSPSYTRLAAFFGRDPVAV